MGQEERNQRSNQPVPPLPRAQYPVIWRPRFGASGFGSQSESYCSVGIQGEIKQGKSGPPPCGVSDLTFLSPASDDGPARRSRVDSALCSLLSTNPFAMVVTFWVLTATLFLARVSALTYDVYPGLASGDPFDSRQAPSAQACVEFCAARGDCTAAVFLAGFCYFERDTRGLYPYQGIISYLSR